MPGSVTHAAAETCDGPSATPTYTPTSSSGNPPLDTDLRRLVEAWGTLPRPLRAGIMAMVEASSLKE